MFIQIAQSGSLAYGICQTGCNTVWVACVTAAGGVAGVSTGGTAVPAAILACNAAQGTCIWCPKTSRNPRDNDGQSGPKNLAKKNSGSAK